MTVRVLHLAGSAANDFLCNLSLIYARDCWESTADAARFEFHAAYVTPDRRWCFPADLSPQAIRAAMPMPLGDAVQYLSALQLDVVLPQMFCIPGMTTYRALFDLLGIPVVGNSADVMALTANKARAKAIVAAAGVPVPAGEVLGRGSRPTIAPPAVVKPVDGDNSLGVTLVLDEREWAAALTGAFEHSDDVLVEPFIELGREVRCGIVVRDGELICLPLEEYNVDSVTRPIRSHHDKINRDGEGDLYLVAKDSAKAWLVDIDDPITERVWDIAKKCHEALGCRHYSLFDFRIDPSGQPWFLEAGLYCSFARQSVIAVMARSAGISLDDLFLTAIHEARSSNQQQQEDERAHL